MKVTLVIFLIGAAYLASAVPIEEPSELTLNFEKENSRFIKVSEGEGNLHDVDLEAEPDMELLDEITRNPADNQYLLFTRRNPHLSQSLTMNNADSVLSSFFNPNVHTIVIVHGWLGSQYNLLIPTVRDAYLFKSDCNVIVMEWNRLALSDYVTAVLGVPAVGRGLGQFLMWISSITGAPLSSMHLAGHSLGAHVVGNAGRETGGRVARVTGLDPAGPLWATNIYRLNPSDAVYTEAIHTDGGVNGLGLGTNICQVDFYPNGGAYQPGCLTSACNHDRAWEFFAATVTYNHLVGRQCATALNVLWNTCTGSELQMGNDILTKTGSGIYRVNTGLRYPY